MTQVKICGIRRRDDALVAVDAGATMLGFVFAPSSRRVTPEEARAIIHDVCAHANVRSVGVFVNAPLEEMNRLAEVCGLDYVQLSGDEPEAACAAVERPVIKALHVSTDTSTEFLATRIKASSADIVMLDTARAGSYGGTGESFDWTAIPPLDRPVLLAGGLHAGNVAAALTAIQPWGVDVSSGVETNCWKDPAKIRAFLRAAMSPEAMDLSN